MSNIRIRTPAKINLFLRILARRSDGYHEIETLFQAVTVYDELILTRISGRPKIEVPDRPDLENEDNLIMRGLRLLERQTGLSVPVCARLNKSIPVAAGLGGGSSDAAAALVGANALLNLGLSRSDLHGMCEQLGADVPFFLDGGTAVGEGVGDKLTQIDLTTDYELALVNPGFPVPTAQIYGAFDRTLTRPRPAARLWERLREAPNPFSLLENDLQGCAEAAYPEIAEVRGQLQAAGVENVLMSGSGPTVFGLLKKGEIDFDALRANLPKQWQALFCRPETGGVRID
jgi:4-diphosphocytidyl-2-C-methyl-D-erythritol kinase